MADTILVIAEQREGKLNRVSLETVAAAQAIAAETGATVEAALFGSGIAGIAQEIAAKNLAKVTLIESPKLAKYEPDGVVAALKDFINQKKPTLVLMPHTYQVRDFAPQLATALQRTLISDAIGFRKDGGKLVFTRQMFQGKFAAKQAVDLTQAEIIVSVGRGIKEQKNIDLAKALADALGGEIAASRPICDSGWLPMDRQIGSSGQTVSPKLYLAVGISGAIQHIVGMKGSRSIIAINKDAEAPIFEIADFGVVGNLFDILPALTEEVKKAKGS
jgi:electron transfer flavoprotein alpha subunit